MYVIFLNLLRFILFSTLTENEFLIETAKHAWIVWSVSAIESTSHETWNGYCKQFLRLFLRGNEASFIISCSNFKDAVKSVM